MKVIRYVALSALLALAACSKKADEKPAVAATPVAPPVVTINGQAISQQLLDDYVKAVAGENAANISAEDREQIKENLVRIVLIAQQAEKDGVTKDAEVATRIELSRLNLIQQAVAARYLKERVPTDTELRAEFDSQLAGTPLVEYQAKHILVDGEDVALKAIQQLQSGTDFGTLARRLSKDKTSAEKGGDLGWFAPNRMVRPFADAVALLKKGEYTKTPVQTQFGWHVIQLTNTRDRAPPAFDDVKEQLGQIVLQKKFKAYSDEMIKTAKIDPPLAGTPAAATTAPAAATPAPATN